MVVLQDLGVLLNYCSDGCSTFCAVAYQENRERLIWQSCHCAFTWGFSSASHLEC